MNRIITTSILLFIIVCNSFSQKFEKAITIGINSSDMTSSILGFQRKLGFFGGLRADYSFGKILLSSGVFYSREGGYLGYENPDYEIIETLKFSYFEIPSTIGWDFQLKKFSILPFIGFRQGFMLTSRYKVLDEIGNNGPIYENRNFIKDPRIHGANAIVNRYNIEYALGIRFRFNMSSFKTGLEIRFSNSLNDVVRYDPDGYFYFRNNTVTISNSVYF
jgi:hypothetical protein